MPRYFIKLAFKGKAYHGWQRQPNASSVQQSLEEALAMVLRRETPVTGAGRTDAGVNASKMFAHCDLPEPIADERRLVRALNSILGNDVTVYGLHPVADDAHARFDATSRTYHYYAHLGRDPFLGDLSWQCNPGLDFEAMNLAASRLLEVDDFTSFAKLHSDAKTNICRVTRAEWIDIDNIYGGAPRKCFVITADRFLRNMVRAVVGTLVDVGRGKLSVEGFSKVIDDRDRCSAGTSMPPEALFLHDITYPYPVD